LTSADLFVDFQPVQLLRSGKLRFSPQRLHGVLLERFHQVINSPRAVADARALSSCRLWQPPPHEPRPVLHQFLKFVF
jgi:hypothetical protein